MLQANFTLKQRKHLKPIKLMFRTRLRTKRSTKRYGQRSRRIVGVISPHAGYSYSGPVAATGYNRLSKDGIPEIFIILGPNHSGRGSGVSIQTEGVWQTPLGSIQVESTLAKQIQKASEIIDIDDAAHATEHSIEVQLPFIQFISKGRARFIPICYLMQDLKLVEKLLKALSTKPGTWIS